MTGSIRDWPAYLKKCYDGLAPGGSIELMDILYPLVSDDGTLSAESPAYRWSVLLQQAFAANGQPMDTAFRYKEQLAEIGFVDVVEVKSKWPTNGWPKDKKFKQIGNIRSQTVERLREQTGNAVLIWGRRSVGT